LDLSIPSFQQDYLIIVSLLTLMEYRKDDSSHGEDRFLSLDEKDMVVAMGYYSIIAKG